MKMKKGGVGSASWFAVAVVVLLAVAAQVHRTVAQTTTTTCSSTVEPNPLHCTNLIEPSKECCDATKAELFCFCKNTEITDLRYLVHMILRACGIAIPNC
ncbi:hypothetical protein ACP275_12G029800 [Erythranthe tilingii]